jgi:hypothetical protein
VTRILRTAAKDQIIVRFQAHTDWEMTFPEATNYDRFDAMADALENDEIVGRRIEGMLEAGDVYAFWFYFGSRQLYGKINLLPSRDRILIYSSHLPRKGDEL